MLPRSCLFLALATLVSCAPASTPAPTAAAPAKKTQAPLVGTDGVVSVSTVTTLNEWAVLATDVAVGATTLQVTDITQLDSTSFGQIASGDLLLVIQMQGATIDTSDTTTYGAINQLQGAGLHEVIEIQGVDRALNRVTFTSGCGGLKNGYTTLGRTQVVRVPQLDTLTVTNTGTVTAMPWNGTRGGIVALHVRGTLSIQGTIDVSGLGFRGGLVDAQAAAVGTDIAGYRSGTDTQGGERGEGIAGTTVTYDGLGGRYGRGAAANAGGGGNGVFAGGGGGANGNKGGTWAGQGVMDPNAIGVNAWARDPGRSLGTATATPLSDNPGGGRGGYSYSQANLNAESSGPGTAGWLGNLRRERGGLGGRPLDSSALTRLYFGGGGGAGDGENASAGAGGAGGGLIYILSDTVSGAGALVANGFAGGSTLTPHRGGGGGGGAGGSVVVRANSVSGFSISTNGGNGGRHLISSGSDEAAGPGGGGSGGFIAVTGGTPTRSAAGGNSGDSTSNGTTEFPVNGATRGAAGISNAGITNITASLVQDVPLCLGPSDLSVTLANGQTVTVPGTTVTYTLVVTNNGPSTASRARIVDTFPGSLSGITWTCSSSAALGCAAASGSGNINALTTLANSESVTYTITATVSSSATGTLVNQASVVPPPITSDPVLTNNVAVDTDTLNAVANLVVTTSAAPSPVLEDGPITWTVNVNNQGPSQASAVTVTFTLPTDVVFGAASGAGWACSRAGLIVTCTRATLAASTTAPFTVTATVTLAGGTLTTVADATATSSDPTPGDNTSTLITNVTAVNDPPVNIVPLGALATLEDTPFVISPLGVTDVDLGSNDLIIALTATNGTITLGSTTGLTITNGTGTGDTAVRFLGPLGAVISALNGLTFTPTPNFSGSATLTYVSNDNGSTGQGGPGIDTDVLNITVSPVNDPPSPQADSFTVAEDSGDTVLDVLANDSIAPDTGETLTVFSVVVAPAHGTLVGGGINVTYRPNPNYFGPDTFTYRVSDGNGGFANAVVTVTVTPVNDPPTAVDDTLDVVADSAASSLAVLANDSSLPDGPETLTVQSVGAAAHGTTSVGGAGVLYTPDPGYSGSDSFTYVVADPGGLTATATVTVTIGAANRAPVNAVPGAQTVAEDTALDFLAAQSRGLSVSDVDAADAGVQITLSVVPGTLSIALDAGVQLSVGDGVDDPTLVFVGPLHAVNSALAGAQFKPPADYSGSATVTLLSNDLGNTGVGGPKFDTDTVTITVTPVNDPPVGVDDALSVPEDSIAAPLFVLVNDRSLPDVGETLLVSSVTMPTSGTASVGLDGGAVLYTPNANFQGTDHLTYTVIDGNGGSATAQVTITVINLNDPPLAVPDVVSVQQDSMNNRIDVLANDSTMPDPPGETLSILVVSQPLNGTASVAMAHDAVIYTPRAGYYGPDSFSYTVQDSSGGFAATTVSVIVGADQDGDGLSDGEEAQLGTDPRDRDSDDDGLDDGVEVRVTMTPPLDDDADDDGLLDGNEDLNKNGVVDPGETSAKNADTDGDGLLDGLELGLTMPQGRNTSPAIFKADADPTTVTSPVRRDTDAGGDADNIEDANLNGRIDAGETDPTNPSDDRLDTDHDGLSDPLEQTAGLNPNDADSDDDGVLDGADGLEDTDGDHRIDALDDDSDNDGILDGTEAGISAALKPDDTDVAANHFVGDADPASTTNPKAIDSDGDGIPDGTEDANHDGRDDEGETDATKADTDDDGLPDPLELTGKTRTNPEVADTDGDGLTDGQEDANADGKVSSGETNPAKADTDGGGSQDGAELAHKTDPLNPDDDFTVSGGGGCSTSPGPLFLLLGALVFFSFRRKARGLSALVALLVASSAQAQTVGAGLDTLHYHAGPGSKDWLDFESAGVANHLQLFTRLTVGYADDPLVLRVPGTSQVSTRLVDSLTFFDLNGGIGVKDHFEVTVGMPVSIATAGTGATINAGLTPSSTFAAGDLRLGVKYSVFESTNPLQLAFALPIWLPTGNGQSWRGGGPVAFAPKVIAELVLPQFRIGASVGANVRTANVQLLGLTVGQELTWGVGAQVPIIGQELKLSFLASLNGAVGLTTPSLETSPMTAMGGLRFTIFDRIQVDASGGAGITRGYGAPSVQVVAAVSYLAPALKLPERPLVPEAPPVVENTQTNTDGTTTVVADATPVEPKRVEPPPPAPDADGDGVPDETDLCPTSAETINGVNDTDGCPDSGTGAIRIANGKDFKLTLTRPITFVGTTAELSSQGTSVLNQLALTMKVNSKLRIKLGVFCTDKGSRGENEQLSNARAKALRTELVKLGIGKDRVTVQSFGMQNPTEPSKVEITTLDH